VFSLAASVLLAAPAITGQNYKGFARGESLIPAQELKHLVDAKDSKLVVLAVVEPVSYTAGHIPGSINVWRPNYELKVGEPYPFDGMLLERDGFQNFARGLGIARASFEEAIKYSQERHTFGKPICEHQAIQLKLADMATKIEASRLLVYAAAEKKDRGERCDLEAGMAKLFATETAQECSLEAMRIFGGNGYAKDFPVERYYRDAPLLIIGGGTNELQRLVIARGLLKKYSVNNA
jgi:rhodanese-related sulfurtransferase